MELEFHFSLKQKEGKGWSLVSVREELVSREEISPSLTTCQTTLQQTGAETRMGQGRNEPHLDQDCSVMKSPVLCLT